MPDDLRSTFLVDDLRESASGVDTLLSLTLDLDIINS